MIEKTPNEALRKALSMGHARVPSFETIPPPPYQLRGCSFLMVGAEFDRSAVSRLVSSELEVVDEATGGFYVYSAPLGWGVAPYTATLAWIDIKGHDSADGSHGRYMVFGAYSGAAYRALRYNASIVEGYAEIKDSSDFVEGVGGPSGKTYLRIGARKTEGVPVAADGTHYYLAPIHAGGICSTPVAFSYDFNEAQPEYVDLVAPVDTPLGQLNPKRLTWAGWLTNGVITIGQQSPMLDLQGAARTMSGARYLNFLTQIEKAAIAIRPDDKVLFQNAAAERLAGDGFWLDKGRFTVAGQIVSAWSAAKSEAFSGKASWWDRKPIGLPRRGSLTPLIAQLVPYQDSLIVLLTDPDGRVGREPIDALQILGLTPAEARIGVLIGAGLEAQAAADRLQVSVTTVRSTMRPIYQKLGITKQSELSNLVARLTSIGV